jgi:hypothetical protein
MYFAYVDESGDSGFNGSPSTPFSLGVLLIRDDLWLAALDRAIAFRRFVKKNYEVPARAELKAQFLFRGGGPFMGKRTSPDSRLEIYNWAMKLIRSEEWPTFAVVVDKTAIKNFATVDPRLTAWTYALQRLERFAESKHSTIHVVPDAGHGYFIRRLIREMRRRHLVFSFYNTGYLQRPSKCLVEDPSERQSHESYFIQFADLIAYSAVRACSPNRFLNASTWELLGDSRIAEVNQVKGGEPGLVVWPQPPSK